MFFKLNQFLSNLSSAVNWETGARIMICFGSSWSKFYKISLSECVCSDCECVSVRCYLDHSVYIFYFIHLLID